MPERALRLLNIYIIIGVFSGAIGVAAQTQPVINANGVVNQATYSATGGVAPGSVATLFGTNLASSTGYATSLPLPTSLAGTSVTIAGFSAPLFYVSPTQINFQVPWELTGSNNSLIVNNVGTQSAPYSLSTPLFAPGVYTASATGTGPGQIMHSDFSLVTTSNPAVAGETVMVLCTGLGAVTPAGADGAAAPTSPAALLNSTVTVAIGGPSSNVGFAGLAPGSVGYDRVDLIVPNLPSGVYTLQLAIGGVNANPVQISVVSSASNQAFLSSNGTVNGASFVAAAAANGAIAPGAIVSIFGSNFAPSVAGYLSVPLSTSLNGISVNFNGVPAPLFYVSPLQVNAQVPYSSGTGTGSVNVTKQGSGALSRPVTLASVSPGLFTHWTERLGRQPSLFTLMPAWFPRSHRLSRVSPLWPLATVSER